MKYTKKGPVSFAITTAIALLIAMPSTATAGAEPFVGEINYVGFNYAPSGWALCNGQELPISQNQALFSLLGTTYGGNGQTTFKLPDMRGRVPVHQGAATSGTVYTMGQTSGTENVTLAINNMPAHNHTATATSTSTSAVNPGAAATSTLKAVNADPNASTAQGNALANGARAANVYSTTAPSVSMNAASIETSLSGLGITTTTSTNVSVGVSGGSQPFSIMQPYTVVNCIIATNGIYPSRP